VIGITRWERSAMGRLARANGAAGEPPDNSAGLTLTVVFAGHWTAERRNAPAEARHGAFAG
jgi:hypothetical protein